MFFALMLAIASTNGYVPMPSWLTLTVWLPCIPGAVAVFLLWQGDSAEHFARHQAAGYT